MNDDDLRSQFHRLRELDERAAPRFRAPRSRTSRPRLAVAAALLVILASAVGLIGVRSRSVTFSDSDRATVQSVAAWQPPTRFLLRTPGNQILTTTPVIPDVHDVLSKGAIR